jgi:hypothetical protein
VAEIKAAAVSETLRSPFLRIVGRIVENKQIQQSVDKISVGSGGSGIFQITLQ